MTTDLESVRANVRLDRLSKVYIKDLGGSANFPSGISLGAI